MEAQTDLFSQKLCVNHITKYLNTEMTSATEKKKQNKKKKQKKQ